MANIFCRFRIFVRKIAFARKEVIPKPIGRQPASLRIRALFIDVANETLLGVGLILHKPEHRALRSRIVLGHARKELDRHGVHRAKVLDLLTDFIIQTGHIGKERPNIVDNALALLFPVFAHAVANVDGTGDQIESCICADMELHMMKPVCDQLIPFRRNALYHFGSTVDHEKHKERLHLAKLRKLLKDRLIVTV